MPYACLAMYPFEPLRPAWERLWAAVHAHAAWTPRALRWPADVHATWTDPACNVTQACGWPVATSLRETVTVVGAFALRLPNADRHRYRSVLIANTDEALGDLVDRAPIAAVNSDDSLSGWISLRAAAGAPADGWPGAVVTTSSHVDSVRAIGAGTAELASIDALTWAYVTRLHPQLIDGLHVVGHGPLVPSLPVIVPATTQSDRVALLRRAFVAAMADPATRAARDELLLDGFVGLDNSDYDSLRQLLPAR